MRLYKLFKIILVVSICLTFSYITVVLIRNNIVESIKDKHIERYRSFSIANEFRQVSEGLTRFARSYAATGDKQYWNEYWNIVDWSSGDAPRPDNVHEELYPGEKIEQLDIMERVGFTQEELQKLKRIIQMSDDLILLEDQAMQSVEAGVYVQGPEDIRDGESINQFAVRVLYSDEYHRIIYEIIAEVVDFTDKLDDRIYSELNVLEKQQNLVNILAIIMLVLIVTGIISLIIYLITVILKRLLGAEPADLAKTVEKISSGNLDVTFDSSVKGVNESLKIMVDKLSDIVGIVSSGSNQIVTASSQLSEGNQDLANRTEQQATALEQTSASILQMNESIRSNAEYTRGADDLSKSVISQSEAGANAVSSMIDSMNDISESSNRISKIIEVINNIAFQTNLLALNASIEAARAGVQGKGFAVVAVEVRKLAKKSDKAASEIADIIKSSNMKVNEGVDIANRAGEMLEKIDHGIKDMTDLISHISKTSREQLASVDEIDKTLSSLDSNTQKNAALVEEAAAATEELSAQAVELDRNVSYFKL